MKTSNVLASVLFGTLAVAAPLNKRARVTKYETVTETQIIYCTVWDEPAPAASTVAPAATTEPGLFYENPHNHKTSSSIKTSTPPAYTPPAYTPPAPSSSSVYTPPAPSSVYTPPPAPSSVYTPPPPPSSVYTPAPVPVSSSPPAQSSSAPNNGGGGGGESTTLQGKHSNYDITVYDTMDAAGACGSTLHDTDMIVALGYKGMGPSTYNYMTGEATMPACGQKIQISYNGVVVDATIEDKCPGCEGEWDIDLSRAVWKALGITETTRLKATWWTV